MKGRRKLLLLVGLGLVGALVVAEPSMAAEAGGSTTNIGRNLGREIQSWGTYTLFGAATVMGVFGVLKQDLKMIGGVVASVGMTGAFAFAQGPIKQLIEALVQIVIS